MEKKNIKKNIIFFKINSKMVSKSNFRKGNQTWRMYKKFEKLVFLSVLSSLKKYSAVNNYKHDIDGNFCVVILANSKIDVGNYSKSVLDSLEGVLYKNDKQVKICISIQEDLIDKNDFYLGVCKIDESDLCKVNTISNILEEFYKDNNLFTKTKGT